MEARVTPFWKSVVVVLLSAGVFLVLNQVFFWNIGGLTLARNGFMYFMLAAFLPIVFLTRPVSTAHQNRRIPLYDVAIAGISALVCGYFGLNAGAITALGWDYNAPVLATIASFLLWITALEALRRTAGLAVTVVALLFSLFPLVAGHMPLRFLRGVQFDLPATARAHAMGMESILGMPLQVGVTILVGFLLFGVALQRSGGATFFYEFTQGLFGRYRGGAAKVSVVSSGFLGMMSGSAVSNVLTTGPMTIPAMISSGFSPRYAAGIEATASTGGSITPPVMGAAAFLMVSFTGVPYAEIALAAAIPALLYYLGIFLQADGYAAKTGLRGLARTGLPRVSGVLRNGWPYLLAVVGLVTLLVVQKNEAQAPYWVIAFLLVNMLARYVRENDVRGIPRALYEFAFECGKTVAGITGTIAGVGLIVGGLTMTGVSLSLARELVSLVGGSMLLILITGAITSFVLGMGMTVSAVYILLAVVMAPALVQLGVDIVAAHLFVIYWATVSYITPPVALAAFAAANIAKSPPMATALSAMRLGAVKYIVPFAFVLNPVILVRNTTPIELMYTLGLAVAAVFCIACAFEGWMTFVDRRISSAMRLIICAAGLAMLSPDPRISLSGLLTASIAIIVTKFFNGGRVPFGASTAPAGIDARSHGTKPPLNEPSGRTE